jgi:N-dimethylarginine dimethylaminohydrolase
MLYRSADDIDFDPASLRPVDLPGSVLLTSPEFFDVRYVINPHMAGNIGDVNYEAAYRQWEDLKAVYEELGLNVTVLDGKPGLPDMVFCANQTLPFSRPGQDRPGVVLSEMHASQRRAEVGYFRDFFASLGYRILSLGANPEVKFEGMGDALWHSGRYLLWGGHGFRTREDAYEIIARSLDVPICLLELTDPDFYHLDTCLSVLDETTALVCAEAFTDEGLGLIRAVFPRVLQAPESEARALFACNAHCPDRSHVIIQAGSPETIRILSDAGYMPVEVETSEYLKSGGSVFCMKQMFW